MELHPEKSKASLSEQHFWEVIAMFDWEKEGDDEAVVEPAVAHLAAGLVRHIFEFADRE